MLAFATPYWTFDFATAGNIGSLQGWGTEQLEGLENQRKSRRSWDHWRMEVPGREVTLKGASVTTQQNGTQIPTFFLLVWCTLVNIPTFSNWTIALSVQCMMDQSLSETVKITSRSQFWLRTLGLTLNNYVGLDKLFTFSIPQHFSSVKWG